MDDATTNESRRTKYNNRRNGGISTTERRVRYTETNHDDKDTTPQSGWRSRYGANERSDCYNGTGRGDTFASQTRQHSRYRSEFDNDSNHGEDLYGTSRFADDESEQQVDRIKQNIRNVKQDTLQSTRNAVQTIHATQDTAGQTLANLNEQAGQIASIDRDLGVAKEQADEAAQKTRYLKRLNRSIFIPAWKNPFNKKARERQKMEQEQLTHAEALDDRDNARQFEYESQARIQRAQQRMNNNNASSTITNDRSQADRNRYQFEADAEDDAMEDEIDQNLNLLGSATKNLKQMANTMGEEIDSQNKHLEKVIDKVNPVNERIFSTTQQLNRIK
ncbi:hypothetical protein BDA99DRAFT_479080 [Phascolomyces articulosus]|uniref:t-SNARE coiled-coil homology domain-containing protein n=1 Tax=Phascolomyces articulosus TaxID=60185 RepID=A0AAD5PGD9_9FUNG|nr:hypothetical protein BDA99DRAFT_479080 [Phascolomyces articulosus]